MNHAEDCFHLGVKALIRNDQGKVLLLQLDSPKRGKCWDIPGGRIQKNESVEDVLKREVAEETGLQNIVVIKSLTVALTKIRISLNNDTVGLILAVYVCDAADTRSIRLSNEHIHYDWFEPIKAAELLAANYPADLTDKIKDITP